MPTTHTLKAFYNAKFCDVYVYDGVSIYAMQDSSIEILHSKQRAIKVQTTDVLIVDDVNVRIVSIYMDKESSK